MRRTVEILTVVLFLVLGLLIATGRLPLPAPPVEVMELLPSASSPASESSSSCASCSLDCPYAGDAEDPDDPPAEELEPVDGTLVNSEELREEFTELSELPLSGGTVIDYRLERPDGRPRVWVDIGTCSPTDETSRWYKKRLKEAGWELVGEDSHVVPDGVFLSFTREADLLNILIEAHAERTNIFVDHPARL
ncbi:MAG: hypothetical protein ACLFSP_12195 [Spirochaetaceae bacterium]